MLKIYFRILLIQSSKYNDKNWKFKALRELVGVNDDLWHSYHWDTEICEKLSTETYELQSVGAKCRCITPSLEIILHKSGAVFNLIFKYFASKCISSELFNRIKACIFRINIWNKRKDHEMFSKKRTST